MKDAPNDRPEPRPLDAATLGAYVDGQLREPERAQVEASLREDEQASACVSAWRAQKAALQALCGPADGKQASFIVLRPRHAWPRRFALAACWLLSAAGVGGLSAALSAHVTPSASPSSFARRADIAYAVYSPEVRHPVEVAATDQAHMVAWLSKRLDRHLVAPSLDEYGYALVGGRLLPGDEKSPAAQFMYQNKAGARLTLYITRAAADESPVRVLRAGDRRTLYWVAQRTAYALSGSIPEPKLRAIAVDVCSALGGEPQRWQ
jgi:anti-sigma factor RsiW